ncbi:DEKNAAC102048 [Brettanomyces naardenensis]|uniref:DEKNAAC102048 n=1 Tax=Brettanomyces naardenensis TaxID=13370 RepID=A0A448YJR2_BRENA|nr:DEKNAAC102048 [Brettanomyces naardenensis]
MFDHTNNSYGVNEVLMSSAMGGIVFGLFAGAPLCIVGVTGPISIFNYTVYELIVPRGIPYFQFMCWICLWSMLLHFTIALTNLVSYMRYITKFSCDVFGFFINIVYIQKGIQILVHQFSLGDPSDSTASGFASITLALVMALFGCFAYFFGDKTLYLKPRIRTIFRDYGTPLCVIFFTGFIHFGGQLSNVSFATLPVGTAFHPTSSGRPKDWFIRFWEGVTVADVFLALPFGVLLTALFYYDHNISSLMCQSSKYPLKKPSSFHYDFLLLGITTGIAGMLGIPAPNGLIPQAPLHTESLCVIKHDYSTGNDRIARVVEQRLSNTFQGILTLCLMTKPLLHVLGLIPQAVLAGLFWIMSITAIDHLDVTQRLRFLCTDPDSLKLTHFPANFYKADRKWFMIYLLFELIAFAFEFGITCTKGAIGFPGVLIFFMGVAMLFPRIFPKDQLRLLDEPAADELILKSLRVHERSKKTIE